MLFRSNLQVSLNGKKANITTIVKKVFQSSLPSKTINDLLYLIFQISNIEWK